MTGSFFGRIKQMATKKKATTTKKAKKATRKSPVKKVVKKAPKKKVVEQAYDGVVRWKAPDYYSNQKGPLWSVMAGVGAIILSLLLIYTGNYFTVIIVILAIIVAFQISHEKPETIEFAIDESGVISRNQYYPFDELESFWVSKHGNRKYILYIETASRLKGPLTIPLGQQGVAAVKGVLLGHLPEEFNYGEMFSDKLIRIFKL